MGKESSDSFFFGAKPDFGYGVWEMLQYLNFVVDDAIDVELCGHGFFFWIGSAKVDGEVMESMGVKPCSDEGFVGFFAFGEKDDAMSEFGVYASQGFDGAQDFVSGGKISYDATNVACDGQGCGHGKGI